MSTNNEELAIRAQGGDGQALLELWTQVQSFAFWIGKRYPGINADDKTQAAQEALLRAVRSYDPDKGAFLTSYKFALRSAFQVALWGGRGEKAKQDPLHTAVSLDAPGSEDADTPLGDLIAVEADFSNVERVELAQAVRNALDVLDAAERQVIHLRYWNALTQAQVAQALNLTDRQVKQIEAGGMKKLRHPSVSRPLRAFL